ncbi:hypothetical protein RhiirA5_437203 [Rhizophagus irregularis]|uniref:Uncharacterized protein n=1 Tax=Rhizophagus irregularis TaxID=588596 RepID=A0A2N0NKT5_9GLOM|nr:hypothetical protein RhiirA5_437203 [Rhizophagus irregularis]
MWAEMKAMVRHRDPPPSNIKMLEKYVKDAWNDIPPEYYKKLIDSMPRRIEAWAELVSKIFPSIIAHLPNFHIIRHFKTHIQNFGPLVNTAVSTKEMVHCIFKSTIPHSNKKNIESDFSRYHNTLQALQYLLDGGVESHSYWFS